MHGKQQSQNFRSPAISRAVRAALATVFALALLLVFTQPAQAQSFQVIHTFTGGLDGTDPTAGVTIDGNGNLYGTAYEGGINYGTVYRLKRSGSSWILNPLFSFDGSNGAHPYAGVIFGPQGLLYGTTFQGGLYGKGVSFKLGPPPTTCKAVICPWAETVLYNFSGGLDGGGPAYGDPTFDQAGNMYGAADQGGAYGVGVVYELTPPGNWGTDNVLYSFAGATDGAYPSGVILDSIGNIYGTTYMGGANGFGTVFRLTNIVGSGWIETLLKSSFDLASDGAYPLTGLVFDPSGNLYGSTSSGGTGNGGTVFELSPSGGSWVFHVLYNFIGSGTGGYCGPWGALVIDPSGNLYGTTRCDGAYRCGSYGCGNVFELVSSNGGWSYRDLYDFTGDSDGFNPISNVTLDSGGNLYGTASVGGVLGSGVVWQITP